MSLHTNTATIMHGNRHDAEHLYIVKLNENCYLMVDCHDLSREEAKEYGIKNDGVATYMTAIEMQEWLN